MNHEIGSLVSSRAHTWLPVLYAMSRGNHVVPNSPVISDIWNAKPFDVLGSTWCLCKNYNSYTYQKLLNRVYKPYTRSYRNYQFIYIVSKRVPYIYPPLAGAARPGERKYVVHFLRRNKFTKRVYVYFIACVTPHSPS